MLLHGTLKLAWLQSSLIPPPRLMGVTVMMGEEAEVTVRMGEEASVSCPGLGLLHLCPFTLASPSSLGPLYQTWLWGTRFGLVLSGTRPLAPACWAPGPHLVMPLSGARPLALQHLYRSGASTELFDTFT